MKNPTQLIAHLPTPSPVHQWRVDYLGKGLEEILGSDSDWYEIYLAPFGKYSRKFYVPVVHQSTPHTESIFFHYALDILSQVDPLRFPDTLKFHQDFYRKYSKYR